MFMASVSAFVVIHNNQEVPMDDFGKFQNCDNFWPLVSQFFQVVFGSLEQYFCSIL